MLVPFVVYFVAVCRENDQHNGTPCKHVHMIDKEKNRMRMGNPHHDRAPSRHALGLHHETGVDERLEIHFVVVLRDDDSSERGGAEK